MMYDDNVQIHLFYFEQKHENHIFVIEKNSEVSMKKAKSKEKIVIYQINILNFNSNIFCLLPGALFLIWIKFDLLSTFIS